MDLKQRREQLVAGQQAAIGQLQQLQQNAAQLERQVQQFAGAIAIIDEQLAPPSDATGDPDKKGNGLAAVPIAKTLSRSERRRLAKKPEAAAS